MGKNLKGKELGLGISQRKDGRYSARFVSTTGKRVEKYFTYVGDARQWLSEAKLKDQEETELGFCLGMTVDSWFNFWLTNIKGTTIRVNTARNYRETYNACIKRFIGMMLITDVRPMHCQMVLNKLVDDYAGSTIRRVLNLMYAFFREAYDNRLIHDNPVARSVKLPKPVEVKQRVLSVEEEEQFLKAAEMNPNYPQFLFVLQTGVRTGEMIGLKWSDIDFENGLISIQRTMEFRSPATGWTVGPTKTRNGKRNIPMTAICRKLLIEQKEKRALGMLVDPEFEEFVFIGKKGTPIKNSTYDSCIQRITDKAGMKRFSMHTLRHSFATRCIEAGMRPKTLQKILGHANISMTMDLYVHVTEDEKKKEIKKFEEYELKMA